MEPLYPQISQITQKKNWNAGIMLKSKSKNKSLFPHYSIVPLFHYFFMNALSVFIRVPSANA